MANDTALQFDDADPFAEPPPPPAGASSDCFVGALNHVIMFADDTGYAVLAVAVKGSVEEVKCVGNTVERPSEGLEYEFVGGWTNHPRYGRQFKFASLTACRPSDAQGLVRYLGSGVIKGIGAKLASVMVGYFGDRTLEVLDQCEESVLLRVPGIGRVKAAAIVEQWAEKVKYREVSIKLMSLGISAFLCVRIIKHFEKEGQDAWAGIMADPYCLTELWGVGFKTADGIGRKVGIGRQDARRLRAATIYALQEARDGEGHCYLEKAELIGRVNKVCDLPVEDEVVAMFLCDADGDLQLARSVVMEPVPTEREFFCSDTYWLSRLHRDETVLAARLKAMAEGHRRFIDLVTMDRVISDQFPLAVGFHLTDEQAYAVGTLSQSRLGVLTGGPGTGKTAMTRALVMLAEAAGMEVALASPTGRAAKRLEEMTGHEAKTLHRLLGWSQSAHDFVAGPNNPLEHDLIIVDEASMVDVSLARALVEAIRPTHTQLILVGDKDQLPSVGPGSVLNDVIKSGRAEVCELTQIMRQAEGSGIVADAHAVNHGRVPAMDTADCTFVARDDTDSARMAILALVAGSRGQRVEFVVEDGRPILTGYPDATETQVLTPMRKGPLGTVELNRVLQAALNPPVQGKPELVVGKGEKARTYRLGDRVLQTRNDYDRGVMNGDIGMVSGVDVAGGEVTIQFPETAAVYGRKDLSEVDLAYCLTIHKSQGGEYTNVITIAHWSHYIMLQRNLLYTALTRAKTKATVIGEMRAVERCVSNNKPARRNTRLAERMAG